MNPGETQSRNEQEDAELGEALHHRLSQLAARLQRLTGGAELNREVAGESLTEAQIASDAFDDEPLAPLRREPFFADDRPLPVEHPTAPPDEVGVDRIASALRDLDRDPPAKPASPPASDSHAAEARLRSIRERIEALKARHADTPSVPPLRPEAPAPARNRPLNFNAAIEEITARQRAIDEGASEKAEPSARPQPADVSAEGDRAREISDLRRRIDDMVGSAGRRPAERSASLPTRTSSFASADPSDSAIADLSLKLDDLKLAIGALDRAPGIEAIRVSQEVLERRLDEMARHGTGNNFAAVAQQLLHRLPTSERIDALSVEIDRLSERISTADQSGALLAIADRLDSFEHKLGGLRQGDAGQIGQRLEAEIAGLRDAVDGLYRMLHNSGGPGLTRLEDRLSQLSARLEAVLDNAPRADSVTDLLARLEQIAARGESAPAALETLASEIAELRARERTELANLDTHLQTLAQRLDEMVGGQSRSRAETEQLETRIASLSARLDQLASAAPSRQSREELAQIEQQLASLTARLDEAGEDNRGLNRLEQQVASLMQQIEVMSADSDALHKVQDNLSRLETIVHDSDAQSSDAIQAAAREAVRELSGIGGAQDSDEIRALKADLRELQESSRDTSRDTGATLDRIVQRLASLEEDVRRGGTADAAPRHVAAEEPIMPRSRPAARSEPAPAQPIAPETAPIEPGARRAEPQPATTPLSDRERRADFIAAARRAAQAAAAEHGAMRRQSVLEDREESETPSGPGPLARFGQVISNHRRPIIIGAAAVVLAIAAFQIAKPFLRSNPNPAPAATPAVESSVDPEASAPAAEPAGPPVPEAALPSNINAAAAPAFVPPQGVVSPRSVTEPVAAAPTEEDVPAEVAVDTVYPMPADAVGSVRLRVAAASGDPAALYEVGARYAEGNGVPRDLAEAAVWLERAAETGLAVAQHRLATQYEAGLGVPEDRAIAFEWYSAAAEQGNVMAMHNLGVMLSQGIEGDPDFAAAIEWFTAAAEHGIRDSQYNLGVIYARGIGVDQDLVASYVWFALAAAQGDSDASARRDEIASALSTDQLATGRATVSAWTAEGAPAAANMVDVPPGGWDAQDEQASGGDRQQLVATIQSLLAERGFDPGPADGVAGPMTIDAVRDFQSTVGLEPTGTIDTQLLTALNG